MNVACVVKCFEQSVERCYRNASPFNTYSGPQLKVTFIIVLYLFQIFNIYSENSEKGYYSASNGQK